MLFSNTSSALALNPCANPTFQPPIYTLGDIRVVRVFDSEWGGYLRGTINFTLSDVANNHSLSCDWGRKWADGIPAPGYGTEYDDWGYSNCVDSVTGAAPASESHIATLLNLDLNAMLQNKSPLPPVRIAQYWWCDTVNGSYPDAPYQAHADFFLDVSCPQAGEKDSKPSCNATRSVTMKAQWIPRGTLFPGTHHLERRPTTPPQAKAINPPPPQDCTEISFSYLDWTVHDLTYVQPVSWDNPAATASFNTSISHQPTGVRWRCQWGAEAGVTERWSFVSEYFMLPVCKMEGVDPLNSNSSLLVRFNANTKSITVDQSWRCGDTAGTYSTDFTARTRWGDNNNQVGLPFYCSSRICTLDTPFKIEGMLKSPAYLAPARLQAPPGISEPGCLRKSTEPNQSTGTSPLALARFLWQATTVEQTTHFGTGTSPGWPAPYNRTLVVVIKNLATNTETSCSFNDGALDGETDRWWPCFRDRAQDPHQRSLQRTPETWIQFSAKAGQLRVNSTWYCNSENGASTYKISATAQISKTAGGAVNMGLICGSGNNTVYAVACPPALWIRGDSCDYTYAAKWCTLGDRDGYSMYRDWTLYNQLSLSMQGIETVRLPAGDLTEPDPTGVWSCTVASLGRGPVQWTLQQASSWIDFFALTDWFGWINHLDPQMNTMFVFNLNSSVFAGRPRTAGDDDGVIKYLGTSREENGPFLTPGMRDFDPSRGYTSGPGSGGFYNPLGGEVKFDISTGYMELKHSWYCDDKNLDTPVIFNGTWNGYVPLNCTWEFPGPYTGQIQREGIVCRFPGGKTEMVVTPTVTVWVSDKRIS